MTTSYLDEAADKLRSSNEKFESLVKRGLGKPKNKKHKKAGKDILSQLHGDYVAEVSRADLNASLVTGKAFVLEMVKHKGLALEAEGRGEAPIHYYFATFVRNDWTRSDRITEINIDQIKVAVASELRRKKLSGVIIVEVDGITNYPQEGKGRALTFHAHVIAWSSNEIDEKSWERELKTDPRWRTTFGAKPLVVKRLTPDTIADRTNIAMVAAYMFKAPHDAKNRVPRKKKPGEFRLMQTTKGYQPNLALRIAEVLSQIPMRDMVMGVGDGAGLVRRLFEQQRRKRELDSLGVITEPVAVDVAQMWSKLRKHAGSENYQPFKLLTGKEQAAADSFIIPPVAVPRSPRRSKRRRGPIKSPRKSRPGWKRPTPEMWEALRAKAFE